MSKKHNISNFIKVNTLNNPEYVAIRNLYCKEGIKSIKQFRIYNGFIFLSDLIDGCKFNDDNLINVFKKHVSIFNLKTYDCSENLAMLKLYNNILLQDNLTISDIVSNHTVDLLNVLFPYYNKIVIRSLVNIEAYPKKLVNFKTLQTQIQKEPRRYGYSTYEVNIVKEDSINTYGPKKKEIIITNKKSGVDIFKESELSKPDLFGYRTNSMFPAHRLEMFPLVTDNYTLDGLFENPSSDFFTKGTYVKIHGIWHKYK